MTITDVKLISETGQDSLTGGVTYERVYHVYFTDGYSTAALIANTDDDLPKKAQAHPDDAAAIVTAVKPSLHEDSAPDAGIAIYTVSYAQIPAQGFASSPLDRPPVVSGSGGIDINETVQTDLDGKGIVNSVGDLYDPLPERPKRGGSYTIVRNQAGHPGGIASAYSNTLNDATFYGKAAGTCQMGKIGWTKKAEVVSGATVNYYEVTFPLTECADGFRFKAIDNGFRRKNDDDEQEAIIDGTGHAPTVPILLDGEGHELAAGTPPVPFPDGGYKVLHETDWSILGLPNPFNDT